MTRSAGLTLAFTLAAGLAARAAEPDRLIPPDADTVAVVNVKQVLGSDVVKKYALEQLKQVLDGQDVKKILTDVGLDPLKDVDQVVVASADTSRRGAKLLVIARGAFDPDKLIRTAEAKAKELPDRFAVVRDGNATLIRFTPDGGDPVFAAVPDGKTVVASNEQKVVAAAVAAAGAARPAAVKKELAELIRTADDKASLYVVSVLAGKFDGAALPGAENFPVKLDALNKVLPKLEAASVAVNVGADVTATMTLRMADDASAKDMQAAVDDLLKQVKPFVQLAAATEARYKPLLDVLASVKTAARSKEVTVSGKVTGDDIAKILNPGN